MVNRPDDRRLQCVENPPRVIKRYFANYRPHLMREPVVEIGAAAGVGDGDPLFVA
jgi:hypothetical protein